MLAQREHANGRDVSARDHLAAQIEERLLERIDVRSSVLRRGVCFLEIWISQRDEKAGYGHWGDLRRGLPRR